MRKNDTPAPSPELDTRVPVFQGLIRGMLPLYLLILLLTLVGHLAALACVLEKMDAIRSLRRGLELLFRHPGTCVIFALALGGLSAAYSAMMSIPGRVFWTQLGRALERGGWGPGAIFAGASLVIFLLLFSTLVGGVLTAFNETAWTVLYGELMDKK